VGQTTDVTIWDARGNPAVVVPGAALPGARSGVIILGSDGTNVREFATDSTGRIKVVIDAAGVNQDVNLHDAFENGITSTSLFAGAVRALDVSVKEFPTSDPANTVQVWGEITTSATTADQIIASYTVPSGKDFYLASFFITRITDNSVGAIPASLAVFTSPTTAIIRKLGLRSTASGNVIWESILPTAIKIATAADVIRLRVTPTGSTNTLWGAALTGYLK
jgi:hypothetical protein